MVCSWPVLPTVMVADWPTALLTFTPSVSAPEVMSLSVRIDEAPMVKVLLFKISLELAAPSATKVPLELRFQLRASTRSPLLLLPLGFMLTEPVVVKVPLETPAKPNVPPVQLKAPASVTLPVPAKVPPDMVNWLKVVAVFNVTVPLVINTFPGADELPFMVVSWPPFRLILSEIYIAPALELSESALNTKSNPKVPVAVMGF